MATKFLSLLSIFQVVANAAQPLAHHEHPTHTTQPQARNIQNALQPRETGTFGKPSDYEHSAVMPLQDRANEQFVFAVCPEELGRPPKDCSWCGGDNKVHGVCNDLLLTGRISYDCIRSGFGCTGYYCQCTHEGEEHNPEVTSTAVVDGQTGTVIWAPLTLPQYSNLKSKTTVTVTDVATATEDDSSHLETAVVAVFAGGIAWLAISESGGAAAVAAIQPPNHKPEDAKEDDKSCKDPKEECPNCGGSDNDLGLCKEGDQAGCPCEEVQNCPNEPLLCSNERCGGDNGQSQCNAGGEIKGCQCCPDEAMCMDDECKGNPLQECTSDKWKFCGCILGFDDDLSFEEEGDDGGLTNDDDIKKSIESAGNYAFTKIWNGKYEDIPGYATKTEDKPEPTNNAECPIEFPNGDLPADVFHKDDQQNVHSHFCEGWKKEEESKMTVNNKGEDMNTNNKKRTPPTNVDSYGDWRFDLAFKPNDGGGDCQRDCNDAFANFAGACSGSSSGRYMYAEGTFDSGCGTFSYKTYNPSAPPKQDPEPQPDPTTELKEYDQWCYPSDAFDTHGDVHESDLSFNSGFACAGTARDEQKIKKDDESTFIHRQMKNGGVTYQYNIFWKSGCTLAGDGQTEMFAANPLNEDDPGHTRCQESLIRNWRNCNNGGRGGVIQIGCLKYEFKASDEPRDNFD